MNNEIMSEELKNLFLEDLMKDIFTYPNHKFSLRYKFQKSRIIKKYKKEHPIKSDETISFQKTKVRIPLKLSLKYVFLIIILLMMILGFTVYRYYSGIYVREYDVFSMLSVEYDENSPKVLTERFYIDMDMSEYEMEIMCDNEVIYWVKYKVNGVAQFDIMQTTLAASSNVRLNTENAIVTPTNVVINNWSGMYYQSNEGTIFYYFKCDDYIMSYSTNLGLYELEKLVKSTKFIQT